MEVAKLRKELMLAGVLFILGLGLVTQLRLGEGAGARVTAQSENDLVKIVDQLDREIKAMQTELTDLRVRATSYQASATGEQTVLTQAEQELAALRVVTGAEPARGDGINLEITDANHLLAGFDLHQIVEELRLSGAQALAINGWRIGHQSSFWRAGGSVYMDGNELRLPYRIQAIGPADLLNQALTLPSGVRDKLIALRGVGIKVRHQALVLPPLKRRPVWRYAKPAPS